MNQSRRDDGASTTRGTAESRPQFDHLIVMVEDPGPIRELLATEWGLHVHSDSAVFGNGLANLLIPLEPPQYLEILFVVDLPTFEQTEGAPTIDRGLIGWALRTWDMAAVERVLDQPRDPVDPDFLVNGSLPPWSTLSRSSDPLGYPFYIEYGMSAADRLTRWKRRLVEVKHREPPAGIGRVEVSSPDVDDLRRWLAPAAHLDIRVVQGPPSVRATIDVGGRQLRLSSEASDGIVSD